MALENILLKVGSKHLFVFIEYFRIQRPRMAARHWGLFEYYYYYNERSQRRKCACNYYFVVSFAIQLCEYETIAIGAAASTRRIECSACAETHEIY